MSNGNKENKSITLIPIAMMFLIIGTTMSTQWMKYSCMVISIILSVISLFLALKNSNNSKNK